MSVYKDSEQLSSSLVRSGSASESDLYTLAIGGLTEADYGNYSCVARNNLGTSTDSVLITGVVCIHQDNISSSARIFQAARTSQ